MKKLLFATLLAFVSIVSCSKKAAPTSDAKAAVDGAGLFSKNCARCHGPEGIKDERTPNLQTIPLDKAGLVKSITYGKGDMPAFQEKLSEAEIAAVADLIVGWHNR